MIILYIYSENMLQLLKEIYIVRYKITKVPDANFGIILWPWWTTPTLWTYCQKSFFSVSDIETSNIAHNLFHNTQIVSSNLVQYDLGTKLSGKIFKTRK